MTLADRIREHFKDAFRLADDAADSLLDTSREALAQTLAKLHDAVECADTEQACHWAHSLKGNLLNSGLPELAETAADIESMTGTGPLPVKPVRDKLFQLFAALEPFLADDSPVEY